ncbi:MAG: PKD domain-containing protein [Candidatus Cloacimonadota bacterium]|nr:PKD domain-containing protein [Candidatus Cloacimonadota bacterium]
MKQNQKISFLNWSKKSKIKIIFLNVLAILIFSLIYWQPAYATHFVAHDSTEYSMQIIIPSGVPTIDDEPLVIGDEIAVFTQNDSCAGMIVWGGTTDTLIAWGNTIGDSVFMQGENIRYRLWSQSADVEVAAFATESSGVSIFYNNTVTVLSSLDGYNTFFSLNPGINPDTAPYMTIVAGYSNVLIIGNNMEVGDEIAVFTENDICAGIFQYTGSSGNILFRAYGSMPGFFEGEKLNFRMWDYSTGIEYLGEHIIVTADEGSLFYYDGITTVLNQLEAISVSWKILGDVTGTVTGTHPDSVSNMIVINTTPPNQWTPDNSFVIEASYINSNVIHDSVYIAGMEQIGFTTQEIPDYWVGNTAFWDFSTSSISCNSDSYNFIIISQYESQPLPEETEIHLTIINGSIPNGTIGMWANDATCQNLIAYPRTPPDSIKYFCNIDTTEINVIMQDNVMAHDMVDNNHNGLTDEIGEGIDLARPFVYYFNGISFIDYEFKNIVENDTTYLAISYQNNFNEGRYKIDLYAYDICGLQTKLYSIDPPDTLPDIITFYSDIESPHADSVIIKNKMGTSINSFSISENLLVEDSLGIGEVMLKLQDPLIETPESSWIGSGADVNSADIYHADSLMSSRIRIWHDGVPISNGEQIFDSTYINNGYIVFQFPNTTQTGNYIIKYMCLDRVGNVTGTLEKVIDYHYLISQDFIEPQNEDSLLTSLATATQPELSGHIWTDENYYPELNHVTFQWAYDSNHDSLPDGNFWYNDFIDEPTISLNPHNDVVSTVFRIKEVPLYTEHFIVKMKAFNEYGSSLADTHGIRIIDDLAPIAAIANPQDSIYNKITFPQIINGSITYNDLPNPDILNVQLQCKYFTATQWQNIENPITYFATPDTFSYEIQPFDFFDEYFTMGSGEYQIRALAKDVFGNISYDDTPITSVQIDTSVVGPIAVFSESNKIGFAPLEVDFQDLSLTDSSPIISWLWDFGDGGSSNIQNPTHEFTYVDSFEVTLIVETANNADTTVSFVKIIEPTFVPEYTLYTSNPYSPMILNVVSAKFYGIDLEFGDELGIYDSTLCVGTGVIDRTLTNENILSMRASADNPDIPQIDGFISGNEIIYKIYDASSDSIYTPNVKYYNSNWDTIPGIFQMQENIFADVGYRNFKTAYTGNPYLPASIFVQSATFNENDLQFGDEIGVFDGEVCVGTALIHTAFSPSNPLSITISADNPYTTEKDGFTLGQPIQFKIWDYDEEKEYTASADFWSIPGVQTQGIFVSNNIYVDIFSTIEQNIELFTGWNLTSFNIFPADIDLDSIVDTIKPNLNKIFDEQGNLFYYNSWNSEWVNNIGNITEAEGYYISMNGSDSLNIIGSRVSLPVTDTLLTGWNILGYPFYKKIDALQILDPLIQSNNLKNVIDEAGQSIFFWNGAWVNGIGKMEPGEAYYTEVSENCEFDFSYSFSESAGQQVSRSASQQVSRSAAIIPSHNRSAALSHFSIVYPGNPYLPMNINILDIASPSIEITEGDEIGIFDGEICVGANIVPDSVNSSNILSVIASADNPNTTEIDGFIAGNPITLKYWDKSSGIYEYDSELIFWDSPGVSGDSVFAQQGIIFTEVTLATFPNNSAIYSGTVSVFGVTGSVGDTIKVFDPARNLCGLKILTEDGYYDSLAVTNAAPGEKVIFDYYDVSAEMMFLNVATDSVWIPGTIDTVNIDIVSESDTLLMQMGWNLISFDILFVEDSPDSVFKILIDDSKLECVKGFDPLGQIHGQGANNSITFIDSLPPGINTLNHIQPGFAYWVKLNEGYNFYPQGLQLDPEMPLFLSAGWNLIGYLPQQQMNPESALMELGENLITAKGFDPEGITHGQKVDGAIVYNPSLPPEFNTINFLQNGFGYWYKINYDDTLIYNALRNNRKSINLTPTEKQIITQMDLQTKTRRISFENQVVFTPYSEMYYGEFQDAKIGDIVLAYDADSVMCGFFTVNHEDKFGAMAVYGDDPFTKSDEGLTSGDEVFFKLWSWEQDKIFDIIPQDLYWQNGGMVELSLKKMPENQLPTELKLHNSFPNPFQSSTNIKFQIPQTAKVDLKIYNIRGQLVKTLMNDEIEPGFYAIEWNGTDKYKHKVGNGVYFYKLQTTNKQFVKKLILLR